MNFRVVLSFYTEIIFKTLCQWIGTVDNLIPCLDRLLEFLLIDIYHREIPLSSAAVGPSDIGTAMSVRKQFGSPFKVRFHLTVNFFQRIPWFVELIILHIFFQNNGYSRKHLAKSPVGKTTHEVSLTQDSVLQGLIKIQDRKSEEHTSELQSRGHLVCRLLLEKKKKVNNI